MKIRKQTIALLVLLIVCAVVAVAARQARRPGAAPQMQESGKAIIRNELARIRESSFGRSERGKRLIAEVEALLEADRVVFSAQLNGRRGLSWPEWVGPGTVFIRVIEAREGKCIHQLPSQIMESLFHEALHSVKGRFHGTSVEEECDAFAAGLCAEAASKGVEPPDLLTIDGMPVGDFVAKSYPTARRAPKYQPVAESMDWLKTHTGLTN